MLRYILIVSCASLVLAVPKESTKAHGACGCNVHALPGFSDATCSCVEPGQRSVAERFGLTSLLSLETAVSPFKGVGCDCEGFAPKGFQVVTCVCDAKVIECPSNTTGHPNCWPEAGFRGRVAWNDENATYVITQFDTEVPIEAVELATCGPLGTGAPFCKCVPGYGGAFTWEARTQLWRNNCTAAQCPKNGGRTPNCVCDDGYATTIPIQFHEANQSWTGECKKVSCPPHTIASSHPVCTCAKGYTQNPVFDKTAGTYSQCKLAECVLHADHDANDDCGCGKGYYDEDSNPVVFDYDQQKWTGECLKRNCPAGATGHPHCFCDTGFYGTLTWNTTSQAYDGECRQQECPANALSSEGCKCKDGYVSSTALPAWNPDTHTWVHNCTALGCPEGNAGSDPSVCKCDLPGYVANPPLKWTGSSWGSCSSVPCPQHSEPGTEGTCTCSKGFFGKVDWSPSISTWVSTCAVAVCPTYVNCNSERGSAECIDGYAGTVTWNADTLEWVSTCKKVNCPVGSNQHPTCKCHDGYVGGKYGTGELLWFHNSSSPENSKYRGYCVSEATKDHSSITCNGKALALECPGGAAIQITAAMFGRTNATQCSDKTETTCDPNSVMDYVKGLCEGKTSCTVIVSPNTLGFECASSNPYLNLGYSCFEHVSTPCDELCQSVTCPDHSTKNADGSCTCDMGYHGSISWAHPVYVGSCAESTCPVNATGHGPSCSCPKGYLPSADWGFVSGSWVGKCEYQAPMHYTKNWPDLECVEGAWYVNNTPITWQGGIGGVGYRGGCKPWPCPTFAEIDGVCNCKQGYALMFEGKAHNKPEWDSQSGKWKHTCEFTDCPAGATGHPNCACLTGFSGHPKWEDNAWTKCAEVPCPESENMVKVTAVTAPWLTKIPAHDCMCKQGYTGTINFDDLQRWQGQCSAATCPVEATCSGSTAECARGYIGKVSWGGNSFTNSAWNASCTEVACPTGATGFPDCFCHAGYAGGQLQWSGSAWSTCRRVECPELCDRLPSDHCVCQKGYQGNITWDGSAGVFHGSCSVAKCVEHASGAPNCKCGRARVKSQDFGFSVSQGKWVGECEPAPCPEGSASESGNCTCGVGYKGTLAWNDDTNKFDGVCEAVECPPNSAGANCDCVSGYTAIAMWNGTDWKHNCQPVGCPENSVEQVLPTGGYTCMCKTLYHGIPDWTGTEWNMECKPVDCPEFSTRSSQNASLCICDAGYRGHPTWMKATMAYNEDCTKLTCPDPSVGPGGAGGCFCPAGYTGDCNLDEADQEYDCTCKSKDCPANAHVNTANGLCTCDVGYSGTLSWEESTDSYTGTCTKRRCVDDVANSEGHPNCQCLKGYAGKVTWNDDKDVYEGSCTKVQCPTYTEDHPTCVPISGYRFVGGVAITWNNPDWKGSAEIIPCPAHSSNPPNCDCDQGYSPDGLALVGQAWLGSCVEQPCTANHPGFPNCHCDVGYTGSFAWNSTSHTWISTCAPVPCPENASKNPLCACNQGYKGTVSWKADTKTWEGSCERVYCPPYSEGHPNCQCRSGYTGTIVWKKDASEYVGQCDMVACPAHSHRVGGVTEDTPISFYTTKTIPETGTYRIKRPEGDFDAYVMLIGSERWVKALQWADMYVPTTKSFGMIATADKGTGKLSDAQINYLSDEGTNERVYRIDWNAAQKDNDPRLLFLRTSLTHADGQPSFGIMGNGSSGALSVDTPTDKSSWVLFGSQFDSLQTQPEPLSGDKCNRLIMGGSDFDCVGYPGFRCLTGGRRCVRQSFPILTDVVIYIKLNKDLLMYPTTDQAKLKMSTLTVADVTQNYTSPIPSCDCDVGCSGGYDWVGTDYAGTCDCFSCPPRGDCSALESDPHTAQTVFPCTKGYAGSVSWTNGGWKDECSKVECPEESTGHPNCACQLGYRGHVQFNTTWDNSTMKTVASYTEFCDFVACPQGSMTRGSSVSGLPTCTCPVAYNGKSVWNSTAQVFDGAQACSEVHCPDPKMVLSDDKRTCTCPVGYNGAASWIDTTQEYIGSATCVLVPCPLGVTCDDDPAPRTCNTYYSGRFSWDATNQRWENNCTLVNCPAHARQRSSAEAKGCVCLSGYSPSPTWREATQSYTGCSIDTNCPAGADDSARNATTGAKLCSCRPGYAGLPLWNEDSASFVHECSQVACPAGSQRQTNNLCDCSIGFEGGLTWSVGNQKYLGSCNAAPCPASSGVDCTYAADPANRPKAAQLGCKAGYFGSASWDYTNQDWDNNCALRPCPANTVRVSDHACNCRWGFAGSVSWAEAPQDYESTCTKVACPSPAQDSGDGHCVCPVPSEYGFLKFSLGDQWQVNCKDLVPCPAHSSGTTDCTCNKGYKGTITHSVVTTTNDDEEVSTVEQTATRSGTCERQDCPAFSLANTFPDCACASGYSGEINWLASQEWESTCQRAECPAHASGAPSCGCNKGYLGSLNFNLRTQQWEGTCAVATCPANATLTMTGDVPSCRCKNGFRGTPTWDATEGWTHTCVDVACPERSSKVREVSPQSYQVLTGFIGCHDENGNPLGLLGQPQDFLSEASQCAASNTKAECLAYAKRACEAVINSGLECWGFAVSNSLQVQLYSSHTSDTSRCDADTGLKPHPDWTSYKRRSAFGDCQCVQGYSGGYTFTGTKYVGVCVKEVCPDHSDCGEKIVCHKGYRGAANFTWSLDTEQWIGKCESIGCASNDNQATFPDCECSVGYAGGAHGWDYAREQWTGECTKVPCVENSDDNFPNCKCTSGFIRSDNVANRELGWTGSEWQQTCKPVACPQNSHRVANGQCSCNVGFAGNVKFNSTLAKFFVFGGSEDMKSCKRVACPANSTEFATKDPEGFAVAVCKCNQGFAGDTTWNPTTESWGTCSAVPCPAHSAGHPYCLCDAGFHGSLSWTGSQFAGSCSESDTTPIWTPITDDNSEGAICNRIRGPVQALATANSDNSEFDFAFEGNSAQVSVLRCDIKLSAEFTQLNGTFLVTPTKNSVLNNEHIVGWNTTQSATSGYIAVGTPYNVVLGGDEAQTAASQPFTVTIPPTAVSQTDIVRFEIHEPSGVSLTLTNIKLNVYSVPNDVVHCIRTSTQN